jgi:hypothetical protein
MKAEQQNSSGDFRLRGEVVLLIAAIVIGIGWAVWNDVNSRYVLGGPRNILRRYATADPIIAQAASGGGVYLQLVNFQGGMAGFASNYYLRSNFIAYPQLVLVGNPSSVMNTPAQILKENIVRDDSWLLDHGVPNVLTVSALPDGFHYQIRRVSTATTR